MAGKRKYQEDSPQQAHGNKSRHRPAIEPRVDPTYGQRSAIPGLDADTTIEGEEEEWINYDDDMDALTYLRAVRQEANGIPNLLVAPKSEDGCSRDIYQNGVGDFRVRYEDGAYYTSNPAPPSSCEDAGETEGGMDPQLAYFDSILARFETLRAQLSQTPPVDAVDALDKDHPVHVGRLNVGLSRWWRWRMKTVDPLPVQIASMDKSTVLRLLGLLTEGTMLKRGMEVDVGVSRWVWGLLARLPESGELASEEVGVVRELGKKAVLVGMGLTENKQWEEGINEVEATYDVADEFVVDDGYSNQEEIRLDENGDYDDVDRAPGLRAQQIGPQLPIEIAGATTGVTQDSSGANNGASISIVLEAEDEDPSPDDLNEEEGFATAKARLLAQLNDPVNQDSESPQDQRTPPDREKDAEEEKAQTSSEITKWNTRATVDMIITVAGEVFGQRDLLEFRSVWGEVF